MISFLKNICFLFIFLFMEGWNPWSSRGSRIKGGNDVRARWKHSQGKGETDSEWGGKRFMVRWKENQATNCKGGNKFMAAKTQVYVKVERFSGSKFTGFYKGGKIFKVESGHKNISCSIGERPQKRVFLLQSPNFPLPLQDNSRERVRKDANKKEKS